MSLTLAIPQLAFCPISLTSQRVGDMTLSTFARSFLVTLAGIVAASPIRAEDKPKEPKDLIVGKWQSEQIRAQTKSIKGELGKEYVTRVDLVFEKDGNCKYADSGIPAFGQKPTAWSGKYKLTSDTEIQITMKEGDKEVEFKSKVTVTKDELELEDVENGKRPTKFKRTK